MWTALLGGGASSAEAQAFDLLHGFAWSDGANPVAALVEGSDGALYGTAKEGGAHGVGMLFKINKDGSGFLNLHDFKQFDPADSANPVAALVEGSDGALYGTTNGGYYDSGSVFRINKDGTGFLKLHDFNWSDPANGANPWAGLVEGSDSTLYGTTAGGGVYRDGIVFKINKDGTGFLKLHDFNRSDPANGADPEAGLVEGSDGALYGTTRKAGANFYGDGIVFKINKDGSGFLKLHDFNANDPANGSRPHAGVVEGSDGALYGTTSTGGAFGHGIVFRINKDGSGFLKLHDFNKFDPANGSNPLATLVEGSDGALYGTTDTGGVYFDGIVFKINKNGTGLLNLHDFNRNDPANGSRPQAGVVEGSDGAFYGTTVYGGPADLGVVFVLGGGCTADEDLDGFPCSADCDDNDPSIYPGAPQLCDGKNNDCNDPTWPTVPSNELDQDGDAYATCGKVVAGQLYPRPGDCDDGDPDIYPLAPEIQGDGIDQDCQGGDAPPDPIQERVCRVISDGPGLGNFSVGTYCSDNSTPPIPQGQLGTRIPVLLVHGWNCCTFGGGPATWGALYGLLSEAGFDVWEYQYDTGPSILSHDLTFRGTVLLTIKEVTAWDRVSVIAHSQGGLVTRSYLQSSLYPKPPKPGNIENVILIGSPHFAFDWTLFNRGDHICDLVCDSVEEMAWLPFYCYSDNLWSLDKKTYKNPRDLRSTTEDYRLVAGNVGTDDEGRVTDGLVWEASARGIEWCKESGRPLYPAARRKTFAGYCHSPALLPFGRCQNATRYLVQVDDESHDVYKSILGFLGSGARTPHAR